MATTEDDKSVENETTPSAARSGCTCDGAGCDLCDPTRPIDPYTAVPAPTFGSQPRRLLASQLHWEKNVHRRAGWLPIINVGYAMNGRDTKDCGKEKGVTYLPAPYGCPTPYPRTLTTISYLEARAIHYASLTSDPVMKCLSRRSVNQPAVPCFDYPQVNETWFPKIVEESVKHNFCPCERTACQCVYPTHVYFGADIGSYSPEAVAYFLLNCQERKGYAIAPNLTNICGDLFKGEATYHYVSAAVVNYTFRDGASFQALDCRWLQDGYLQAGGVTIRCTWLEDHCGIALYVLSVVDSADDPALHSEPCEWQGLSDQASQTYTTFSLPQGPNPARSSIFDWALFRLRRIQIYSNVAVFTTTEDNTILFSRDIAWRGARSFMGQERTQLSLTRIIRWTSNQYNTLTNLPERLKYEAQLATVVFIMSQVELEAGAVMTLASDFARVWSTHGEIMALRPPLEITPTMVVGSVAWTSATYYAFRDGAFSYGGLTAANSSPSFALGGNHAVSFKVNHVLALKAGAAAATATHLPLVLPVWLLATSALAIYSWSLGHKRPNQAVVEDWMRTAPDKQPVVVPPGVYQLPKGVRFEATTRVKTVTPPQDPNCKVITPKDIPDKAPTAKVCPVGICFGEIPRYHESTAKNEAIALRNRTTLATPPPKLGLWNQCAEAYLAHPSVLPLVEYLRHPANKYWYNKESVARYAAKFPPARRNELLSAYDEFKQRGYSFADADFRASMFIKGELHLKPCLVDDVAQDEPEEATPRTIISFQPIVNATLGPLMQFYSDVEKKHRLEFADDNVEQSPLAPTGVCGETIGEWFTYWVNFFGGPECVYVLSEDSTKHDAHHSPESREATVDTNIRLVQTSHPTVLEVYDHQMKVKGRSVNGVRFIAEGKRWSGESATSKANTHATEMKACYQLEGPQPDGLFFRNLGVNYAIGANGDDGTGIIRKSWLDDQMRGDKVSIMTSRSLDLGFHDTVILRSGPDGDFCSRWWYPVAGGYLPGGKIGRVLAKAGFFFDHEQEQSYHSAVIGQLQDNGHVPFLREYFERARQLARTCKLPLRGKPNEFSIHMRERHSYDDSTLDFVEAKYGLTRQDLAEFKARLAECKSLPVLVGWPHLEKCLAVDLA